MAFNDFLKTVKNETGDAIEITKLKAKKSKEKTNIKENYEKIGEIIYKKYKETGVCDSELTEFMTSIDESRKNIATYNDEIAKLKNN